MIMLYVGGCTLFVWMTVHNSDFLLLSVLKIKVHKPTSFGACIQCHEDSMNKLQGDCVSWLVLLTGAAQFLLVCGEGMLTYDLPASVMLHVCRSVLISGNNQHHH